MTEQNLTYDRWLEIFKPVENNIVKTLSFNGCIFETYGPEVDFVKSHEVHKIWTLVDCDGVTLISPGYHLNNRNGYFITEVPWCDVNLEIEVWKDSDFENQEEPNHAQL